MTGARPSHLIFDLDGTLVDSAVVCADILNAMLAERRSPRRLCPSSVRVFMTRGGPHMIAALLADECGDVDAELADFRARYAGLPTPPESLFPGVREGLVRLAGLRLPMAICSNKPQHLCEKILADLKLAPLFDAIVGSRGDRRLKPSPDSLVEALDALRAEPRTCVLVGDSQVDEQTAAACGLPFWLVTYGYAEPGWHPAPGRRFAHFADLASHAAGGETPLRRVA